MHVKRLSTQPLLMPISYLPGGHIVQLVSATQNDPEVQDGHEAQATFGLFTRSVIARARRSLGWPLLVLKRL